MSSPTPPRDARTAPSPTARPAQPAGGPLASLLDARGDGFSICDYDPATGSRRLVFCNESFVRMAGRSREELAAVEDLTALLKFHMDEQDLADVSRRHAEGLPAVGRASWLRPDGRANVHEFSSLAVKAGKGFRILSVQRDVGGQMAARRALERDRELFEALLEAVPDSIYFKDGRNRFVRVSRSKAEHLGVEPAEVIGKTDADFYPEAKARQMSADDEAVMRTGRPIVAKEEKLTRADGTVRWVSATKVPRHDAYGRLAGTIGISRDVTDLKAAQQELRRRAADIAAARREAESANRARSDFLANMSHEIRTPLNGILGMTELALTTTLNEEQHEYLEAVQHSARSLMALLNDLLDFSKIDAGKLELEAQPFELERTMERLIGPLAIQAHQKGLELTVEVAPESPRRLIGDPHRLGQVIINLVGNAIKFTETGEILLQVEPVPGGRAEDEEVLHFSISDTGIGVPAPLQEAIFESFRQGDSSTTRHYGGTGLGLAICRELVGMMGGQIRASSPSDAIRSEGGGPGSTFQFTAHFRRDDSPPPPEQPRARNLADMRALIIDDNATNRRVLSHTLAAWGMAPEEAAEGDAAVEMVRQARRAGQPYGIVLLDCQMPGMDGFDVADELRGELSGAVVMMLTRIGQKEHKRRCRELGIAHYLLKPISASSLMDSLMEALSLSGAASAPAGRSELETELSLGLSVLLAEDNEINLKVARHMLEKAGCKVTAARTGLEVVEAVQKSRFDCVLMDVQLPGLDGLEATARIREAERETGAHLPVIAMTAHAMKDDRENCLAAGMDDHVPKPIDRARLLDAIGRWTSPGAAADARAVPRRRHAPAGEPLDLGELMERVGGDNALARELLDMFKADCPARLAALRAALDAGDMDGVRSAAHEIKGTAANMSAKAVVAAAVRAEQAARDDDAPAVGQALRELEDALGDVDRFVSRLDWEAEQ